MKSVKSSKVTGAKDFFRGELKSVMEKQQVSAQTESIEYLADIMLRYMESDTFFVKNAEGKLENNILADLYAEYIQGSVQKKKLTLQRLGDICLLISGFFSDSLKRKVVDIDYYFGMGGSAYWTLSQIHASHGSTLYKELSMKFKPFSGILGELSERSGLQTNADILRLYERWLMTGSERLRGILSEQGIATPLTTETKFRH